MATSRRSPPNTARPGNGAVLSAEPSPDSKDQLPMHQGDLNGTSDGNGKNKRGPNIKAAGESGRSGVDPLHFFRIAFRSSSTASKVVNVLWPLVPAAIAVHYALPEHQLLIFILSYLAMIPCANMIGFAGQELARKVPHVFGVLVETTLGSVVEIILFGILVSKIPPEGTPETGGVDYAQVIKAAILGSVLATMLLCLGLCFVVGGIKNRGDQTFSEAVSEAGSGLLLTAGFGLAIPTVFYHSLLNAANETPADVDFKSRQISRITAVLLLVAYLVYVYFQARTHHGIFDAIFEEDEEKDNDRHRDLAKAKLTLTECIVSLAISIALVSLLAVGLVLQIPFMVEERHVSDAFLGLILVPLVEKAAEHLTAIDEAYDNQMNFALSHVLGATLQTALFNGPLAVIVAWGLNRPLGLNFEIFDMVVLLLAIITVGNFLRDQKSNYLEGVLCVIVYIAIAVAAAYYPNPIEGSETGTSTGGEGGGTAEGGGHEVRWIG